MKKPKIPVTSAVRLLKSKNINFTAHFYNYSEKGGTSQTASELGVDEHSVVKTLVISDENKNLIIVLQHGDKEVSLKEAARQIGVKKLETADSKSAMNSTGYQFGGTSPFGTRQTLPVYVEESIFGLEKIYINGGKRGFILEMSPSDIISAIKISKINVSI